MVPAKALRSQNIIGIYGLRSIDIFFVIIIVVVIAVGPSQQSCSGIDLVTGAAWLIVEAHEICHAPCVAVVLQEIEGDGKLVQWKPPDRRAESRLHRGH